MSARYCRRHCLSVFLTLSLCGRARRACPGLLLLREREPRAAGELARTALYYSENERCVFAGVYIERSWSERDGGRYSLFMEER